MKAFLHAKQKNFDQAALDLITNHSNELQDAHSILKPLSKIVNQDWQLFDTGFFIKKKTRDHLMFYQSQGNPVHPKKALILTHAPAIKINGKEVCSIPLPQTHNLTLFESNRQLQFYDFNQLQAATAVKDIKLSRGIISFVEPNAIQSLDQKKYLASKVLYEIGATYTVDREEIVKKACMLEQLNRVEHYHNTDEIEFVIQGINKESSTIIRVNPKKGDGVEEIKTKFGDNFYNKEVQSVVNLHDDILTVAGNNFEEYLLFGKAAISHENSDTWEKGLGAAGVVKIKNILHDLYFQS